jgi:hypothetical protein
MRREASPWQRTGTSAPVVFLWRLCSSLKCQALDLPHVNAEVYKDSMERIFSQDWDMLVPCHGTIVCSNGKQHLRKFIVS